MANKLTRARKAPRVVKKRKNAKQMHDFNLAKLPETLKPHWDKDKTMAENFERTGLVTKMAPSFRQTKAGKNIMNKAQAVLYKAKYNKEADMSVEDSEEEFQEKEATDKIPLRTLFPEIKTDEEAPFRSTLGKLKWDEVRIVKQLVKKYGKDQHVVSLIFFLIGRVFLENGKGHQTELPPMVRRPGENVREQVLRWRLQHQREGLLNTLF